VKEYIAQMLGAQYAWHRPLEKGKSRLRSWGIWPQYANGPNAAPNTAMIPLPSFKALANLIWKIDFDPRQYARSRYTKYAGAR
jgi:hypothetical protein